MAFVPPAIECRERQQRGAASEEGQAVVEAAIILPAMIFMILCILQLTLLQQARLSVEYAAFNAARAGIVHNMNNGSQNNGVYGADPTSVMRNAAVYSVLASYGRADSLNAITTTLAKYETDDSSMRARGVPTVQVTVLNPHKADFAAFGGHLNGKEIDFDDMRPDAAAKTLLSIQVRYLFELRVPFANKMLQSIWLASQVGLLNTWDGFLLTNIGPTGAPGVIQDGMEGGLNVSTLAALGAGGRFYMPVDAWFTMRMQSNPYLQWAAP